MDVRHPLESVIPGAQGKALAVLLQTTSELNLRTIARLAGISVAQASRVLPGLVELGVIERREVPPASLFRLVPDHVITQSLLALANARRQVLDELGRAASRLHPTPSSVIVFGSFARGDGDARSDIDLVVVRPSDVDADDPGWLAEIDRWKGEMGRFAGNTIEALDLGIADIADKLATTTPLWTDIHRDGVVVFGLQLHELTVADNG
jgi:hypothetical protein